MVDYTIYEYNKYCKRDNKQCVGYDAIAAGKIQIKKINFRGHNERDRLMGMQAQLMKCLITAGKMLFLNQVAHAFKLWYLLPDGR